MVTGASQRTHRRPIPQAAQEEPGCLEMGLADAELQLITGHSQRTSLQIYQHIAVDRALAEKYQEAMRGVEL